MKEQPQPNRDFREQFQRTPRFQALIDNTHSFLSSRAGANHIDFQNSFAGRLFEELGYSWYREHLSAGRHLLNPDETINYFLDLYSGLPSQALLQGGILNEYVPDGVILGDEVSKGGVVIVEYTARGRNSALPKYIHHKGLMVGALRKRYPEIFGKGRLQIVFTHDTYSTVKSTRDVDPRTTLMASPYKHDEVHAYAQELVVKNFDLTK